MNVRLLGVLLMVIGLVFALQSMTDRNLAKQKMAALEIQDYYRKTGGSVYDKDLVGVTKRDLEEERDAAQQHMTWALVLAAVGLAVALSATGARQRANHEKPTDAV